MNRISEIEKQMEELRQEKLRIQKAEAEEKLKIESEKKKKLESEKKLRREEIELKNKELQNLYKKYSEDYGQVYTSHDDMFLSLLDIFNI